MNYILALDQGTTSSRAIVFDHSGVARFVPPDDVEDQRYRSLGSKTFIHAAPPAEYGQPRFVATFSIDAHKRLCVTVRDNVNGKLVLRDQPMVTLT